MNKDKAEEIRLHRPVQSLSLDKLSDPLPIRWRIMRFYKSHDNSYAICAPYVADVDIMDRLDEVCTPTGWQTRHRDVAGAISVEIGIRTDQGWVYKGDISNLDGIGGAAAQFTYAFKGAAGYWGIGRRVTEIDEVFVPAKITREASGNQGAAGYVVDDRGRRVKNLTEFVSEFIQEREPQKAAPPERTALLKKHIKEHIEKILGRSLTKDQVKRFCSSKLTRGEYIELVDDMATFSTQGRLWNGSPVGKADFYKTISEGEIEAREEFAALSSESMKDMVEEARTVFAVEFPGVWDKHSWVRTRRRFHASKASPNRAGDGP